jgi:DNA invertase Pin-like site-specific DNA recombinase
VDPDNIHQEHASGVARRRPGLERCLKDIRRGDILVIWKLDRLGRSLIDLLKRIEWLDQNGIGLRSLTEHIDTQSPVGRMLIAVLGSVAQFERDLIIERTRAGMMRAREQGKQVGAKLLMTPDRKQKVASLIKAGLSVQQVAKQFKIAPNTIYNHFDKAELDKIRPPKPKKRK